MTDKKYPPRVWIKQTTDELGRKAPYAHSWEGDSYPLMNKQYLSLDEHASVVAELERKLGVAREALKKIDHYGNGVPGTYSDPIVVARAALKEIDQGEKCE